MIKRICYIYVMISICLLSAIDQVGTSGSMGSVTIDGKLYNQISTRPELAYGRLGIGLDVYLYFNYDGIYDVLDVVTLIDIILNSTYHEIADFNEDQIINVLDIVLLLNLILNN